MSTLASHPVRALRAHALKNCLAVVSAVNKLVERELSEISRERMARSHEAVRRMGALLAEDLEVEGEQSATNHAFVCSEDIVRAVVARVEDVAEAAGTTLVVHAGAGGVIGDAVGLAEALGNIVLNAIQATPVGGVVLVATYECPDRSQLWVVQDTGRGMSAEDRARLGTQVSSCRPGGSGLGFAAARELVERHGGITRVDSSIGAGTVVSIWLPVEEEDEVERRRDAAVGP
jgi:signal transduction histidine kinase